MIHHKKYDFHNKKGVFLRINQLITFILSMKYITLREP